VGKKNRSWISTYGSFYKTHVRFVVTAGSVAIIFIADTNVVEIVDSMWTNVASKFSKMPF